MFFRVYLVLRAWTKVTKWRNEHSDRCCEIEGVEAGMAFSLKSLLKEKPLNMLFINFFASAVMMGIAVRNLERPYYTDLEYMNVTDDGYQDYNYLWN